ncbi:MAG: TetR/AcrR family transcriptional regulator [Bacteroidales bacterium]|jgi:AcrR family transcriptional regulator|nr:TetR/AcrR family transcriptional regulator [Bacteroidales bacterium]
MKDKILQHAYELFMQHGIRKMSIPLLTAVMGISSKTVYKYFRDKEELLEEVLKIFYREQFDLLTDLQSRQKPVQVIIDVWYSAIAREYNVNNIFYYDLHYYYPELEKKMDETYGSMFWKEFEKIIKKGIDEGSFIKELEPLVALEAMSVLYKGISRTNAFEKFGLAPLPLFLDTLACFIRGICTPQGARICNRHISRLKPVSSN